MPVVPLREIAGVTAQTIQEKGKDMKGDIPAAAVRLLAKGRVKTHVRPAPAPNPRTRKIPKSAYNLNWQGKSPA